MDKPKRWLLLRGLVREVRHWDGFDDRLRAALGDDGEVLALDLPGVGTEREKPCPTTVPKMVDDLRGRFLAARGDRGPFGLFAASLGGMVALDWAARYPGDFVRVAVSNTSARDLSSLSDRLSTEALSTIFRAVAIRDPIARERAILGLVSNTERGRGRAEAYVQLAKEAPVPYATLVRQLAAASRARSPAALTVPLLVLASEGDRMVSPACSRAVAKRYDAELRLHPTGGHDLPLDDPEWVLGQLLA